MKTAEQWLNDYHHYAGIEPTNTYDCLAGMNAGQSAEYCWEQYQKANSDESLLLDQLYND